MGRKALSFDMLTVEGSFYAKSMDKTSKTRKNPYQKVYQIFVCHTIIYEYQ